MSTSSSGSAFAVPRTVHIPAASNPNTQFVRCTICSQGVPWSFILKHSELHVADKFVPVAKFYHLCVEHKTQVNNGASYNDVLAIAEKCIACDFLYKKKCKQNLAQVVLMAFPGFNCHSRDTVDELGNPVTNLRVARKVVHTANSIRSMVQKPTDPAENKEGEDVKPNKEELDAACSSSSSQGLLAKEIKEEVPDEVPGSSAQSVSTTAIPVVSTLTPGSRSRVKVRKTIIQPSGFYQPQPGSVFNRYQLHYNHHIQTVQNHALHPDFGQKKAPQSVGASSSKIDPKKEITAADINMLNPQNQPDLPHGASAIRRQMKASMHPDAKPLVEVKQEIETEDGSVLMQAPNLQLALEQIESPVPCIPRDVFDILPRVKGPSDSSLVRRRCSYCQRTIDSAEVIRVPRDIRMRKRWIKVLGTQFQKSLERLNNPVLCKSHFPLGSFNEKNQFLRSVMPIRLDGLVYAWEAEDVNYMPEVKQEVEDQLEEEEPEPEESDEPERLQKGDNDYAPSDESYVSTSSDSDFEEWKVDKELEMDYDDMILPEFQYKDVKQRKPEGFDEKTVEKLREEFEKNAHPAKPKVAVIAAEIGEMAVIVRNWYSRERYRRGIVCEPNDPCKKMFGVSYRKVKKEMEDQGDTPSPPNKKARYRDQSRPKLTPEQVAGIDKYCEAEVDEDARNAEDRLERLADELKAPLYSVRNRVHAYNRRLVRHALLKERDLFMEEEWKKQNPGLDLNSGVGLSAAKRERSALAYRRLSKKTTTALEKAYKECETVTPERCRQLGEELGESANAVNEWFIRKETRKVKVGEKLLNLKTVEDFMRVTEDDELIIATMMLEENFFDSLTYCLKCNKKMNLRTHGDKLLWRCRIGNSRNKDCSSKSVKACSWFGKTTLSLSKSWKIIFMWLNRFSSVNISTELKISPSTVVDWRNILREACVNISSNYAPIGGEGKIVELGEFVLMARKYKRDEREKDVEWLIGGIERGSRNCFAVVVPDRSPHTLIPILKKYINVESEVHSDMWQTYDSLGGIFKEQKNLDRSIEFERLNEFGETGYTNSIGGFWQRLKKPIESCGGTPLLDGYIAEAVVREREDDNFTKVILEYVRDFRIV